LVDNLYMMSAPAVTPDLNEQKKWWVLRCANDFRLQLLTLLAFSLFLNREGDRVPSGNELVYLLYFFKAYHPHLLATDWTFQETTAGHGFFNHATGWVTLFMSLEHGAWVGRIVCWLLAFVGLLRVGRHFKIPPWAVWGGVMLWLIQRQAVPTTPWTEWMIGSFEAKCPAYVCLLFAIDFAVRDKVLWAGLLAGLSFSFHSAVGLWGGAALGWAVMLHNPIRRTAWYCGGVIVASLPGLISSLPLVMGKGAITAADSKFLVTSALPLCLDPYTFSKAYVALLAGFLAFAALHRWWFAGNRRLSILFQFELGTAIFFALAFAARAAGRFDILKLYMSRVYGVFAMLLFFWQLTGMLYSQWQQRARHVERFTPGARSHGPILFFGIVLFLSLPSPVAQLGKMIVSHLHHVQQWIEIDTPAPDADLENTTDFRAAADWVAHNTPEDAVVIAPPWRADAFYFLRRPLIANWHAFRYDKMSEWRKRIESMVGDLTTVDSDDAQVGDMDLSAREHYRHLTPADIARLQRLYTPHASWLVTTSTYPYPRPFSAGVFNVYRLPQPATQP
jgi:hypothetical protein